MAEPSLCSRPTDSTKPRMVVVWPFTENVCCPCSSCPLQAALHWGGSLGRPHSHYAELVCF